MRLSDKEKGGGGRRGVPRHRPMTTINMTPFINSMRVLLIIFMVSAPLLTSSIELNPPPAEGSPINWQTKPVKVGVANAMFRTPIKRVAYTGATSNCNQGRTHCDD